ncbi:unnamed protein product [Phaedon cochleariae]|uniref:WAP domain-containing protein n=1 Tax=Phaedon cochleariae TaxID=80249 RepID=A0A9N9SCL3_PHACE|nr:unnamed protein product [Phaedon cochleariae]
MEWAWLKDWWRLKKWRKYRRTSDTESMCFCDECLDNEGDLELCDPNDESLSPQDMEEDGGKVVIVGVCAMEKKTQSKPMKEILTRLQEFEYIKVTVFEEDVILHWQNSKVGSRDRDTHCMALPIVTRTDPYVYTLQSGTTSKPLPDILEWIFSPPIQLLDLITVHPGSLSCVKPGSCPNLEINDNNCEEECRTDADCTLHLKCCSTGCGTACVDPTPPAQLVTQQPQPAYTEGPIEAQCKVTEISEIMYSSQKNTHRVVNTTECINLSD